MRTLWCTHASVTIATATPMAATTSTLVLTAWAPSLPSLNKSHQRSAKQTQKATPTRAWSSWRRVCIGRSSLDRRGGWGHRDAGLASRTISARARPSGSRAYYIWTYIALRAACMACVGGRARVGLIAGRVHAAACRQQVRDDDRPAGALSLRSFLIGRSQVEDWLSRYEAAWRT